MNKSKDFQFYITKIKQLRSPDHNFARRKVIQSRTVKLSADAAYLMIGKFFHGVGEFQNSIFPLRKAIIINPESVIAHVCLTNSFLRLGKEIDCFFTLQKALAISSREPAFHSFIIKILKELKRLEELSSFYQEVATRIKDKNKIIELYFCSAEILENSRMIPQALEQYKKASQTNSMKPEHFIKYADALVRHGFLEEAIVQFEHIGPDNVLALNNMASLHYELGRVEKAYQVLEYIIHNGLQTEMTYLNLILVLEEKLDRDEEVIKKYKSRIQNYIQRNREEMHLIYKIELQRVEEKLKNETGEKARELYNRKLKGLKTMSSLLDSSQQ